MGVALAGSRCICRIRTRHQRCLCTWCVEVSLQTDVAETATASSAAEVNARMAYICQHKYDEQSCPHWLHDVCYAQAV
jgi:hypothetical protein